MASVHIKESNTLTISGGTANGYVGVSNASSFLVGSQGSIYHTTSGLNSFFVITEVDNTNSLLGLRLTTNLEGNGVYYGRSDCSGYLTGSVLTVFNQAVAVSSAFRTTRNNL